jgi:synaptobrevin family protein YKT6
MTKLYGVYVLRRQGEQATILDVERDFSDLSFIYRKSAIELCDFAVNNLVTSPKTDRFMSAQEKQFLFQMFRKGDAATVVVTSADYPTRVSFTICKEVMAEYDKCGGNFPGGKCALVHRAVVEYQNPANADKLLRIQQNLDECRDVMTQNLQAALARGESLEELAQKSSTISDQSKLFAREAAKMNRCCSIF